MCNHYYNQYHYSHQIKNITLTLCYLLVSKLFSYLNRRMEVKAMLQITLKQSKICFISFVFISFTYHIFLHCLKLSLLIVDRTVWQTGLFWKFSLSKNTCYMIGKSVTMTWQKNKKTSNERIQVCLSSCSYGQVFLHA